jgi:hypothetical protein
MTNTGLQVRVSTTVTLSQMAPNEALQTQMQQQEFKCVLVDPQKIGPNFLNPPKNEFY